MKCTLVLCLTIVLLDACSGCGHEPESNEISWHQYELQCLSIRALESRLQKAEDSDRSAIVEECLEALAQRILKANSQGSTFQRFYHARLLMVSADKEKGKTALQPMLLWPSVAPEALSMLDELSAWTRKTSVPDTPNHCAILARVLPLSAFRSCVDGANWRGSGEIPVIPVIHPPYDKALTVIADRFFEMHMFEDASRAYRETIYGSFHPAGVLFSFGKDESWLSQSTGRLWLKVAESEWHCGNTKAAADHIAKCIVFGSDDDLVAAIKRLHEFDKEGNRKRPIPAAKPNSMKLIEIAETYAEQNMHPRAIELVQRFQQTIGDEAKLLEAKYQKDWQELVRRYVDHADRAVLFGQEVYSKEKGYNFAIKIPPPCSPEAMEEIRKAFKVDEKK